MFDVGNMIVVKDNYRTLARNIGFNICEGLEGIVGEIIKIGNVSHMGNYELLYVDFSCSCEQIKLITGLHMLDKEIPANTGQWLIRELVEPLNKYGVELL